MDSEFKWSGITVVARPYMASQRSRPVGPTHAQSQMKMLRRVKNEIFTLDFDSEITLVDCTLER